MIGVKGKRVFSFSWTIKSGPFIIIIIYLRVENHSWWKKLVPHPYTSKTGTSHSNSPRFWYDDSSEFFGFSNALGFWLCLRYCCVLVVLRGFELNVYLILDGLGLLLWYNTSLVDGFTFKLWFMVLLLNYTRSIYTQDKVFYFFIFFISQRVYTIRV